MHYTRDYSKLEEPEKSAEALKDIKGYLGAKTFNKVNKQFRAEPPIDLLQFEMIVSFGGVQGFPVQVWYNHLFPKETK